MTSKYKRRKFLFTISQMQLVLVKWMPAFFSPD